MHRARGTDASAILCLFLAIVFRVDCSPSHEQEFTNFKETSMKRTVTKRQGGVWETKLEWIELDELKLDPRNVRFRHVNGVLGDKEIEKKIWEEYEARDLMKQIIASGGLTNHPIVSSDRVVKEGNRRVVCCRRIREQIKGGKLEGLEKNAFEKIECEVLPPDADPVSVNIYLAREHVTGKKEWDALNKAALIYELYEDLAKSYEDIRDYLGIGKAEVIRMEKAYAATVEFMRKYPKAADIRKFVYFSDLFKRRVTAAWANQSPSNLERFMGWLASDPPKFSDSRQMRRLGDVLDSSQALAALMSPKGNMETAIRVLDARRGGSSQVFKALARATDLLDRIPRNEYRAIADEKEKADLLRDLHGKIETLFEELRLKF
jgi:hypothetical protein